MKRFQYNIASLLFIIGLLITYPSPAASLNCFEYFKYIAKKSRDLPHLNKVSLTELKLRSRLNTEIKTKEVQFVNVQELYPIHNIDRPAAIEDMNYRSNIIRENIIEFEDKKVITESMISKYLPSKNPIRVIKIEKDCYVIFDGNGRFNSLKKALNNFEKQKLEVEVWTPSDRSIPNATIDFMKLHKLIPCTNNL